MADTQDMTQDTQDTQEMTELAMNNAVLGIFFMHYPQGNLGHVNSSNFLITLNFCLRIWLPYSTAICEDQSNEPSHFAVTLNS